jgi:hypothetical protein
MTEAISQLRFSFSFVRGRVSDEGVTAEREVRNLPASHPHSVRRWAALAVWTLFILWSMDVARPSESAWVGSISKAFVHYGFPEWTPAKLYHFGSFVLWTLLLSGALARGYRVALNGKQIAICLLTLIAFATIPEGLQRFNAARTPAWFDACVNFLGGLMGLAFQSIIARNETESETNRQ